ncbi:hypothetical protein SSABA_v1c01670 [Spiroplasma sabaudiense Ar-1343]|uniref:Transmembrane protein n=1 Tax=Spiroplasma sabaudiense Ar-1343 TaxID=1276257 RepID=W6AIP7_9MOLU|nr:hypothetical protein [Spiroplasma sabaudiense]AHI53579.1 hypothetical protein SSABA_v1c01670 [Spiroplasma sabaudiense Ar-1343]
MEIYAIFGAIFFIFPFLFWMVIRFLEKMQQQFKFWHKPAIISCFAICFAAFIILITLGIVLT